MRRSSHARRGRGVPPVSTAPVRPPAGIPLPGVRLPGSDVSAATCAFTLIELLTVIAIIGILSAISFGVIRGVKQNAAIAQAKAELAVLAQALEDYKRQYGDYPQTPTPATPAKLYQALDGRLGPTGATLSSGRRFIAVGQFKLADLEPSHVAAADNYLVDPWGNAYLYVYYHQITPERRGFVLYSEGPDGTDGGPPSATNGVFDATAAGNVDNIYANP